MKKLLIILAALMCGGPAIAQQALPPVPLNVGTNGSQTLTVGDCLKILSIGVVGTVATDSGAPCSGGGGTPPLNATLLGTNSAGTFVSAPTTGTGNSVLATSPTLVTPNLGTPSALTLTNATGLPVGGIAPVNSGTIVGNPCGGGTQAPTAISDISCLTALATSSVTARSMAARAAEVFNILDYCASVCTGSAADSGASAAVAAINANAGGQLYYPPGLNYAVSTQHVFTTYAAGLAGGGINTTTILTNGGGGFEWTTATSQSNGGHCSIRDVRLFQNDNATSGAQLLLSNADFCTIDNIQIGGGFRGLELASPVSIMIGNLINEGHNSTSGAYALYSHRINSSAQHVSEIHIHGCNIRADSAGAYSTAVRISDADGFYWDDCHVGFGSNSGILIQAENTSDQLDGIIGTNINCDTTTGTGPCVDLETLAGMTGANGGNSFTGGSISNAGGSGFLANDSNVGNTGPGWTLTGVQFVGNGIHGLDIEAGTGFGIDGGLFSCNNRSGVSANHINAGGNASVVLVGNVIFSQGAGSRCTNAINKDIVIAGTTSNAQIGLNAYSGTNTVSITSSGTGNASLGTFAFANAATPPAIGGTTPNIVGTDSLQISGSVSTAAALTNGIGITGGSVVYTDSSGTGGVIANAYMFALPAAQLRTTLNTTYTQAVGLYVPVPSCAAGGGGTATCTNLLGILTNGSVVAQQGAIITGGNTIINNGGSVTTTINAGSNSGTVTIGNSTGPNTTNLSSSTINMANVASSSSAQTGTLCRGTAGIITYDTTTTCLASDGRLKMNIEGLDVGIDEIMKLRPVSYELKPQFDPTHLGRQVGLIAQDVMAIDPRLAANYQSGPNEGTPSGVRYEQMTALVVKGMQEQQRVIVRQQYEVYGLAAWCAGLTVMFVIRRRKVR